MYLKLRSLLLLLLCSSFVVQAQTGKKTGIIKGKVVKSTSKLPAAEVQVIIPQLKLLTTSDAEGKFNFSEVPYGTYNIKFGGGSIKDDSMQVSLTAPINDLGEIPVSLNEAGSGITSVEIPTIALDESNVSTDDEGVRTQAVSGLLTSSQDPFINAAAFTFGQFWFKPRGYDRNQQEVLINGVEVNDVETGDASWSQFGGLTDIFRSRASTYGLMPSNYAFGGLNGSTYFDITAANQRKQTRVSYSLANRNYRDRIMLTRSSGLMKSGWAYSVSLSKRWAKEGYVPGTFYDGYSYYGAVSKVYKKHLFDLSAFGTPTRRGKFSFATQETYDLAGSHYYNSNWGTQDGAKRNARVNETYQPVFLLSHQYKKSSKMKWNTSLAYQFGKEKNSGIDWLNAADPRPDYYRNLPSYYLNSVPPDSGVAADVRQQLQSNPDLLQLNWDRMYNANYINRETINDVNGIAGNNVTGNRSLYVLSNDVNDIRKWIFNTNLERVLNAHITLNTGINFTSQRTENYRQLVDLLGGDFFLNDNQFAARQYVGNTQFYQNNLNIPNQLIKEGDKYSYDYISRFNKGYLWGQSIFNYNRLDLFISANVGINSFSREGLFRNGLFPDNSYGKSDVHSFITYGVKGGATYKMNGRNYLFVNGGYRSDAPTFDNIYISPRTRDFAVNDPQLQYSKSIEGGYFYRAPKLNVRLVGYATDVTNATEIKRFYNDDPSYQTFVNYVMQNVNMRFIGTEIAISAIVAPGLDITGVASLGQAFYTNNPNVTVYKDNDTATTSAGTRQVYVKNLYLSAGPQSAYTLGFHYSSKQFWHANVNFNYVDRNYVDVNPDRRSSEAADLVQPGSALWHQIFDQEKLPSAFTINLSAGYSWKMSRLSAKLGNSSFLSINAGVNNLLNNQNIVNAGFEQMRYDFTDNNPAKFPNKYSYGYGINYFVNLSLKF